ncbi:sirohydrochlorin cobaltochelatase [Gracilibacillus ureilyticus]|uniref:Sirohydrochlorin cobaltochelatase n=1 Tax=Gracilibacillus ureilyticus TaxID=531814 RepID=A0A1H9TQE3_9BACI|nr:sirohydrochlorin chelatase [Gracilibacillus ureilyticus]SER98853.1 sirohydrochlorin cobaltochelatase [Gracilibacillus ureilyticus]
MEAVIYICHGSRVKESKTESFELINKVKQKISVPIQEACFLELQEPNLAETVKKVVSLGAEKITILPVLLLTAGHAKVDIPEIIDKEVMKYPEIDFHYGRPIGVDDKMVRAVKDHIERTTDNVEKYDIVFVGRGSSDLQAIQDTESIVSMLRKEYPHNNIEKCFLAASKPKFEPFLKEKVIDLEKSVLIVPYLLFTGLLIKGIKEYIEQFSLKEGQEILLSEYLGHHENVVSVLQDRVEEAREESKLSAAMD